MRRLVLAAVILAAVVSLSAQPLEEARAARDRGGDATHLDKPSAWHERSGVTDGMPRPPSALFRRGA